MGYMDDITEEREREREKELEYIRMDQRAEKERQERAREIKEKTCGATWFIAGCMYGDARFTSYEKAREYVDEMSRSDLTEGAYICMFKNGKMIRQEDFDVDGKSLGVEIVERYNISEESYRKLPDVDTSEEKEATSEKGL